jgi:site-specific DNA recombinase
MMDETRNGKRAVLYARVSYDDRDTDGRNLSGQLEMAREYAQRKGYQVVAEIQEDDRGASGATFELEGLTHVLEMAEAGGFDVLIPREIDRLSRVLVKQLIVEEELKRAGVGIDYVLGDYPDTPEGSLMKNVKASVAEYERLKTVERTARARRNAVKDGSVLAGRPVYGYRLTREGSRFALVIHEPEARVVRLVFTWYTIGDGEGGPLSLSAIAEKLKGIPTYVDIHGFRTNKRRERGEWNASTVYAMLRDDTYAGQWKYGKRHHDQDGHWTQNPAESLLSVEVPAIVDLDTWQAAQERMATNKENSRRNRKHEYLLARRLTCGKCGLKVCGQSQRSSSKKNPHFNRYYRCPATRSPACYARECDSPAFPVDQVDAAVWAWVKSFLGHPAALVRRKTHRCGRG